MLLKWDSNKTALGIKQKVIKRIKVLANKINITKELGANS